MPKIASHQRAVEGVKKAAEGEHMPQKKYFRQRAHVNPLNASATFDYPISPERMDWAPFFPGYAAAPGDASAHAGLRDGKLVEVADVGCGFGGLLVGLAPVLPDMLCLGMEIRTKVTEYVRLRILALRNGIKEEDMEGHIEAAQAASEAAAAAGADEASAAAVADETMSGAAEGAASSSSSSSDSAAGASSGSSVTGGIRPYDNVSVLRTNAMKYLTSFFARGQLSKLFFCFPDPHFKKSNHRRRIVSTPLLAEYAHVLRPGGRLYTISDVRDLHNWMAAHGDAHSCFERVSDAELASDPCVGVMRTYTEEGKKVERARGDKHVAVFRRLTDEEAAAKAARLTPRGFWQEPEVHYVYEPAKSQARQMENREKKVAAAAKEAAEAAAAGAGASAGNGGEGAGSTSASS